MFSFALYLKISYCRCCSYYNRELFKDVSYFIAEKMDALELDVVLSEVTLMHTRAELYWRYLRRRLDAANTKTDEHVSSNEIIMSCC